MNNFKKILFCLGMLSCLSIKSEDRFDELDQKIKSLEILIISISQNMSLQQELIQLLQKQLQVNLAIENNDDDDEDHTDEDDHRMTLRIPKSLMAKIDVKRKQRIGKISRNLWILETLDEATRK
ncbi:MAG: hypothetical protein JO129_01140 [Candidatus Dependentiae bacterium]|nr:hypothetical protein [Candidatus Dependentiae bacterium]